MSRNSNDGQDPVIKPLDIFWSDSTGETWQTSVASIEEAEEKIRELGMIRPGYYVVFSQTTRHKRRYAAKETGDIKLA